MGNWSYNPTYGSYNPIYNCIRGPPCSNETFGPPSWLQGFHGFATEKLTRTAPAWGPFLGGPSGPPIVFLNGGDIYGPYK